MLDVNLSLSLAQLATISAVLNGLVFSCLLLDKRENRQANRFLSLALLSMCFTVTPLMLGTEVWNTYRWLAWLPFSLSYWIGPALYFYTRYLTDAQFTFGKNDLWHFAPIILNYFHSIYHALADPLNPFPILHHFSELLESAAIFSILIYMFLCHREIRNYQAAILHQVSYRERIDLGSLKRIILVIAGSFVIILLILLLLSGFIGKDTFYKWDNHRNSVLIFYAGILYWLSINGYRQAQTIRFRPLELEPPTKSPSDLAKILLSKMEKDKLYRNPELSLTDLSRACGHSERTISTVLNGELRKNFFTFVNEFRVDDFKNHLSNPDNDHLKIMAIAYDSGFNSKASFNRVFKDITGLTPNRFRSQIRQ